MKRWIILDNVGVIFSGTEEEAREEFAHPEIEWTGDLVLAVVEEVKR